MVEAAKETRSLIESHYQAILEAAFTDENVVIFANELRALLLDLGRGDVKVITEAHLVEDGVVVTVSITYDSYFPGQIAKDPAGYAKMRQAEAKLFQDLTAANLQLSHGYIFGGGDPMMKTQYDILRIALNFKGAVIPN